MLRSKYRQIFEETTALFNVEHNKDLSGNEKKN